MEEFLKPGEWPVFEVTYSYNWTQKNIMKTEAIKSFSHNDFTNVLFENTIGAEVNIHPCGSYFVCEPRVEDTDIDFLVYSPADLHATLLSQGWDERVETGNTSSRPSWGEANPDHRFRSYRRGKYNFIVTQSQEFAARHVAATELCKRLNILNKADRVAIYQATLYGNSNANT